MHRIKSSREIKTRDTDNIIWIRMDADEIPSTIMTWHQKHLWIPRSKWNNIPVRKTYRLIRLLNCLQIQSPRISTQIEVDFYYILFHPMAVLHTSSRYNTGGVHFKWISLSLVIGGPSNPVITKKAFPLFFFFFLSPDSISWMDSSLLRATLYVEKATVAKGVPLSPWICRQQTPPDWQRH